MREYQPAIATAFNTALDADATIGDRVAHPADRNLHLAGDVWFYYGSRYAEYLDGANDTRSEDFLDSELEHTPANPEAYLRLADYSAGTKRLGAALADYRHSLDLKRDQPAVLDSIAVLQWDTGQHAEALAAWSDAVKRLAEEMDARRVPETFWSDFDRVLASIAAHNQYDSVRAAVDAMLRIYVARNGNYRTEPLLAAGYRANGNSVDWLLDITSRATNQASVLNSILPNAWSDQGNWIDKNQLDRIYRRILEVQQRTSPEDSSPSDNGVDSARRSLVEALLDEKKYDEARAELAQVPQARRNSAEWLPSVLLLAEADSTLDQLIADWKKQPNTAPADNDLRNAASRLSAKASRTVRRFGYERALDRRELTAANFLGLASIDLDENHTAAAVSLLKRLTLISDNMYADLDAAAHLLEARHHPNEALQFLRPLADASPWDASYKVRMAKALLALDGNQVQALAMLATVAGDGKAPYAVRISAAEALKGKGAPESGSDELKLLAQSSCPTPESASKSYFVAARVRAAACVPNQKTKEQLLRDAIATAPDDTRVRLRYIFAAFAANFDSRGLIGAGTVSPAGLLLRRFCQRHK